ncbi:hypothetical protein LTR78_008131 [Recurvomyces mirabilis]|uniref:Major facilitator superfamily (MFS) profile domain-containing protein n=1 Tax=Recurvomyces mirabilis TaxID=574656 RepID=A0AAE0WH31_9PEZI|nr:hypothetical protein LTR78_008131 [Recurvomyces mirabilis]KAK5150668.1 hypothetical protein LTS14_009951 [Recurvomyces mirabilis]
MALMDDKIAQPDPETTPSTITHAKDWLSTHDPANPRNFSLARKTYSITAVTLLAFVTTFAASIYSPGAPEVAKLFNVSDEVAILPLSLYNLGLAFGPLIGSPLSETSGRKIVLLINTPLFALFTLGAGLAKNIETLIICRFFAGVFAAPAVGNASATLTDYAASQYRGISFAFYYSMPTFGAYVGPLIGGFVTQNKGWRWTQWVTIIFLLAFYLPILFIRESYKKTILRRRAKKLGVEGPPTIPRSLPANVRYFATTLVFRPVHMLLTEPIVTLVCLYNGFLFGLMYTFVIASPWVYEHYYHFSTTSQSLSFLGLIIGTGTAPIPLLLLDYFVYQPQLRKFRKQKPSEDDQFPPENRLVPALIGSFGLPISLFIFAWTARPEIHWIVPIIFQCTIASSSLLIYASSNLFMMDAYGPLYGASAAGAAMLSRYLMSTVFPLFSLQMYKALGVGWATSLLGFCTLAMAPIPWLFWKCGAGLRKRSKYETSS